MPPADRERGVALLTVLMLVAVIAVIAGGMLERLRVSTRLSGNAESGAQARAYAFATEALATTRITGLLAREPTRVTLAGGWSGRPVALPVEGGVAVARVTDGGNCFNLNGLVRAMARDNPAAGYASDPAARDQFARLMRLVGVPVQAAERIAASTADWIDTDQNQQPMGAEDSTYLGRTSSFRTGGTLMTDPSELRAVDGMTPEIYGKIRPWLCTLPVAEPAKINVNTLTPEQAPLFAMLLPDSLSVASAAQMILRRPPLGYANTAEFWKLPALVAMVATQNAMAQTAVTTTWFNVRIDVTIGSTNLREQALIDANRLPARLVSRQWGEAT